MSVCRIERRLGDVPFTLVRARKEAEKFHSRWDGDESSGDYTLRTPLGTIEGTYAIGSDKIACFVIEKKPTLIPCGLIERVLDQFLRDGERARTG